MVPYEDSIELTMKGFVNSQAHLFLRDGMTHNRFMYDYDVIKPLEFFFAYHKIQGKGLRLLSQTGFVDLKQGENNQSKYHNNFSKELHLQKAPSSQSKKLKKMPQVKEVEASLIENQQGFCFSTFLSEEPSLSEINSDEEAGRSQDY